MKVQLVKTSNLLPNNSWGIYYEPATGSYLVGSIHGGRNGELSLEWNKRKYPVEPATLRKVVKDVTGVEISSSSPVIINPCHPELVELHSWMALQENKISIMGQWKGTTVSYISKKNTIVVMAGSQYEKILVGKQVSKGYWVEIDIIEPKPEVVIPAIQKLLDTINDDIEFEYDVLEPFVYQFWIGLVDENKEPQEYAIVVNANALHNIEDYRNYKITVLKINKDESFEDITDQTSNPEKVHNTSLMLRDKIREIASRGLLVK